MPPPAPANQPGPVPAAPDPGPPSAAERAYLARGLDQPGGKLPLFDLDGTLVGPRIVRDCLARGLAEPWFPNPLKPDWLVCRLTERGRLLAQSAAPGEERRG